MRAIAVLALMAGLGAATVLLAHYGFAAVGSALLLLGWSGFLAIVFLHLLIIALCGIAWWALLPAVGRTAPWTMVWARLVRDGGSEVLPLSQVGGYVLGARAAAVAGLPGGTAAASTIVDVTMELLAQLAYTAIGLVMLLRLRPGFEWAAPIAAGLVAAAALAAAFVSIQRRGLAFLDRLAVRKAGRWASAVAMSGGRVQAAIRAIYRRRSGLLAGFGLHLACWIASAGEPWLALKLMRTPLDFGAVLAIESLLYAARSIGFLVPNAFGVQEGAYVALGALFGVGPDAALALSVLKRGRDLVLGLPVLLAWQVTEARRAL